MIVAVMIILTYAQPYYLMYWVYMWPTISHIFPCITLFPCLLIC